MRDTLVIPLSDPHSGSNYALFPDRLWQGKNNNSHAPASDQVKIRDVWDKAKEEIKAERKDKNVLLVVCGDSVEGIHHENLDVATRDIGEQRDIHLELMAEFQKAIGWTRGDKLYYVLGTATHVADIEHEIAEKAGAQQLANGDYVANHLQLTINGKIAWFIHDGAGAGEGHTEGDGLRNWLKKIYFTRLKSHKEIPDIIYSGHVHVPTCNSYYYNDRMVFRELMGVILPSLQMKTRFGYRVAAVSPSVIGVASQVITAGGDIRKPVFHVREMDSMTMVKE